MKNLRGFIFWSGILIIIATNVMSSSLSNLDEIWNFNLARCIANGLVPYKDINMVVTPLLSFIVAPFLKLFGQELFITRAILILLTFIIFVLIYNIFRKLNISKTISKVSVISILLLQLSYLGLNYNYFIMCLTAIIILLELSCIRKNSNIIVKELFIGLLGGLAVCTKQTIGVLICGVIICSPLFFINKKDDIKNVLKHIGIRIIGMIIPIIAFIIYLMVNNAFHEFIDYAIKGIKTFSNTISYKDLINSQKIYIKILGIIAPILLIITIVFNIVLKLKKKVDKNLFILIVYTLPIFILVYPIADEFHFVIAVIPIIILFVYELVKIFRRFIKKTFIEKYIMEFLEIITVLGTISLALFFVVKYDETLGNLSKYKLVNHFYQINISESVYKSITSVDKYISSSQKKVYILDSTAAIYMIPLDRYNKDYDLFLLGNLGSGAEEKQIDNIKNEDAKYLILKDEYNRNWQTPERVRSYIKDNMKYIESVDIFDVYENNSKTEEPPQNTENNSVDQSNSEQTNSEEAENIVQNQQEEVVPQSQPTEQ